MHLVQYLFFFYHIYLFMYLYLYSFNYSCLYSYICESIDTLVIFRPPYLKCVRIKVLIFWVSRSEHSLQAELRLGHSVWMSAGGPRHQPHHVAPQRQELHRCVGPNGPRADLQFQRHPHLRDGGYGGCSSLSADQQTTQRD